MRAWTSWFWPALLLVFGIGEGLALFDGTDATQPFTNWTVEHVGAEAAITLLLWSILHFGLRYLAKRSAD